MLQCKLIPRVALTQIPLVLATFLLNKSSSGKEGGVLRSEIHVYLNLEWAAMF
jgi:hypothetical protein